MRKKENSKRYQNRVKQYKQIRTTQNDSINKLAENTQRQISNRMQKKKKNDFWENMEKKRTLQKCWMNNNDKRIRKKLEEGPEVNIHLD